MGTIVVSSKNLALLNSQAQRIRECVPAVLVNPATIVRDWYQSIVDKLTRDELIVTLWDADLKQEVRLDITKRSKADKALVLIAKECLCSRQQIASMLL